MKKNRLARTLILLLMGASAVFFLITLIVSGFDWKGLFGFLSVLFGGAILLLRLQPKPKHPLSFYEQLYARELEDAFSYAPPLRQLLIAAAAFYGENREEQALNLLKKLRMRAETEEDLRAVLFFAALSLADIGETDVAIDVYLQFLQCKPDNVRRAQVYSNLALLYERKGDDEEALSYLEGAVLIDQKNVYAKNNLAQLLFRRHDIERAKRYAMEAVELQKDFYQAASLAAVIAAVEGDLVAKDEYTRIAIESGQDALSLDAAIQRALKEEAKA